MSQSDDAKYLASLKKRYKRATKKERGKILDEYVQTTGYHRKHAIAVLSGKRTAGQTSDPSSAQRHLYRGRCAGAGAG